MSVTVFILNRFVRSRLVGGMCQALDEALASLATLPGDARRATAAGNPSVAAGLGDLAPTFRRHIRTARRQLCWLYADTCKRRSEIEAVSAAV